MPGELCQVWQEVGAPCHQLLQEASQPNKDIKTDRALFIVSSADITARAVVPGTEEHHSYEHSHANHPGHCHLNTTVSLMVNIKGRDQLISLAISLD